MSNLSFTQLATDFVNTAMSLFDEDTFTSLSPGQKEAIFQVLLDQVVEKRQKERHHHALQVLIDKFCYKQGYEESYGPRSAWIRDNRKKLAEVIGMNEDRVEPFFE